MARYRGQKALYEVIGKNRPRNDGGVESLHPDPKSDVLSARCDETAGIPLEDRWRRPRAIQFNAGRVELTLSYLVSAVFVLVFFIGLVGAFRLGQWVSGRSSALALTPKTGETVSVASGSLDIKKNTAIMNEGYHDSRNLSSAAEEDKATPQIQSGRNAIGILTYRDRTQLVPVMEYYLLNGIETEIIRMESGFILVTVERFRDNPTRQGSDGYERLQQIIELGAKYRPPKDYLGFNRESFEGAHGVLIQ
jgi:hypothetical protein